MVKCIAPLVLVALSIMSCSTPVDNEVETNLEKETPVNVILMIGDGMGLSQVSAAFYYGSSEPNFKRFRHIGLSRTTPSSHKITDSAAGATAFSAGVKTYNGAIGLDSAKQHVPTLVEELSAKGWNTGIIATSSITHATPASFYAHVESRKMAEDIAVQLVRSDVDFFAGGGHTYFANRRDSINYLDSLKQYGFVVDTNRLSDKKTIDVTQKYGFLLAADGMPQANENRGDFLLESTELALKYLDQNEAPFFLMVEGSQIDWGGHANDAEYLIQEVLDFDKVIGKVLDFANEKGNTLVVVTADHETGGFTLAGGTKKVPFQGVKGDYGVIAPSFSTGGHSTTLVPVFAYGPGSESFIGVYENTDIHKQIQKLTGL